MVLAQWLLAHGVGNTWSVRQVHILCKLET